MQETTYFHQFYKNVTMSQHIANMFNTRSIFITKWDMRYACSNSRYFVYSSSDQWLYVLIQWPLGQTLWYFMLWVQLNSHLVNKKCQCVLNVLLIIIYNWKEKKVFGEISEMFLFGSTSWRPGGVAVCIWMKAAGRVPVYAAGNKKQTSAVTYMSWTNSMLLVIRG